MSSLTKLDSLGKKLFIQLDNTSKENKNKHLLRFAAQLIERKKFEEVQISFLMVGHTHNDVDQMFSLISKRLFKSNTKNLQQLRTKIRESSTKVSSFFFSFLFSSFFFSFFLFFSSIFFFPFSFFFLQNNELKIKTIKLSINSRVITSLVDAKKWLDKKLVLHSKTKFFLKYSTISNLSYQTANHLTTYRSIIFSS